MSVLENMEVSHGHIWSRNSKFVADIVAAVGLVCDFRHQEVPKKEEAAPTHFVKIPEFLVQSPFGR